MNRQTILASIHRQLRESFAETGEVRPLGEIVARVAEEIRPDVTMPIADRATTVIPIESVASFVDGDVDPTEANSICDAVMVDNSVLAELISAVRVMQETATEQLPPLSVALAAQLHAMPSTQGSLADRPQIAMGSDSADPAADVSEIVLQPGTGLRDPSGTVGRGSGVRIAASLLAIAATIGIAIFMLGRGDRGVPDESMVVEAPIKPPILPDEIPEVAADLPEQAHDRQTDLVADNQRPLGPDDDLSSAVAADPDPVSEPIQPMVETIARDDAFAEQPTSLPREQQQPDLDPVRIDDTVRKLADFKWTEVSGLLTQRNDRAAEPSSQQRAVAWKRIQEGAVSSMSGPGEQSRVAIRTLPFSRASGEFATGGRIVIAADTGLLIDRAAVDVSAEVNLLHGSMAMIDLAAGTLVNLIVGDDTIATLRWKDQATAVLHRQAAGLQIQVDGGSIEINDQAVTEASVRVTDRQNVESIRAPKRLPRWITRPDETTAADRMILAQIANSDDVTSALKQNINAFSALDRLSADEQHALGKLANWYAAMSGVHLYRLANSRLPAVRSAGLQRLAQIPPTDPRYQRTWMAMERAMNNHQRFVQIRGWFQMLQTGTRPNRSQTELMLAGLSSRDFAGRAISDFLLRQYVRNPPPFDPAWTGLKLQRAVRIYRERAGMPIDRARVNAAAGIIG